MTHDPITLPRLPPPVTETLPSIFHPLPSPIRPTQQTRTTHPAKLPPRIISPTTPGVNQFTQDKSLHRAGSFHIPPPPKSIPMRAAFSATPVSGAGPSRSVPHPNRSEQGDSPEDDNRRELDREELTTKGRKRKRLAKACSACHKNKRRCDGFAPCSNCEFSSRPCLYLNAQGQEIPPPRTRDAADRRASRDDGRPNGGTRREEDADWARGSSGSTQMDEKRQRVERRVLSPVEIVERDPAISAELIDIFLRRLQPHCAMIHTPTFQHRLYLGQVSPLLLDSIYALSARLSDNPVLLASLPPKAPRWIRGEAFAERAHAGATAIIDHRKAWNEEEKRSDMGTYEETELVQALYLLSVYYSCIRQPQLGLYYLDVAIDIFRPTHAATLPPPATQLGLSTVEYMTLMEMRHRTFWLLVFHDLFAAAVSRERRLREQDMYNVPLPGSDVHWGRYGGGAAGGREAGRRDGLLVGSGNWLGEEGQVGEFGHAIRVLSIWCDIMSVTNATVSPTLEIRTHALRQEQALKAWANSLPSHLSFDETNIAAAEIASRSSVPEVSLNGWWFTFMHCLAECGMFYLQAVVAQQMGNEWMAVRQGQAVQNIAILMDRAGERGRESCAMLFPLLVLSNWQDHIHLTDPSLSSAHAKVDQHLNIWWTEVAENWGFDRTTAVQNGFYPELPPTRSQRQRPPPILTLPHPHPHPQAPLPIRARAPGNMLNLSAPILPPLPARTPSRAFDSMTPTMGFDPIRTPILSYDPSRTPVMSYDPTKTPGMVFESSRTPNITYEPTKTPSIGFDPIRTPSIPHEKESVRTPSRTEVNAPALGLRLYNATSPLVPESVISSTSSLTSGIEVGPPGLSPLSGVRRGGLINAIRSPSPSTKIDSESRMDMRRTSVTSPEKSRRYSDRVERDNSVRRGSETRYEVDMRTEFRREERMRSNSREDHESTSKGRKETIEWDRRLSEIRDTSVSPWKRDDKNGIVLPPLSADLKYPHGLSDRMTLSLSLGMGMRRESAGDRERREIESEREREMRERRGSMRESAIRDAKEEVRREKQRDWGALGIEALVSAAEVRERERV
ncbi:hypothetical protein M231_03743 [Tremella mesenterica]|uniref:Zn(2)-C6 fungal-type domain-containing protein n=1 Tax=Tremella mesenterica TaxID=5217 RepID=A0A4Q1BMG2_TREME|nr:hypothetical protein M231_03743 [Tremella mesenterica]